MYGYWDGYAGREEEYITDISDAGGSGKHGFDHPDMEVFPRDADDWSRDDYNAWGMSEAEIRSLLED